MEISERIKEIVRIGGSHENKDNFKKLLSANEKKLFLETYHILTGERKSEGCGACYTDIFFHIRKLFIQKNMKKENMTCDFRLMPGKVLQMHGMSEAYTNANLSNHAAIMLLKKNPGLIKFFDKFPSNWMDMTKSYDVKRSASEPVVQGSAHSPAAITVEELSPAKTQEEGEKISKEKILSAKNKSELQALCEEFEFPEKEWDCLSKKELEKYLTEKL